MKESFRFFDTGKFNPGNALALAYASQLAYPGARDINPDYESDEEFETDMGRKAHQAKQWGFDNFAYAYSHEKNILALIMGNPTDIIVAFRGTVSNNFSNWLTDIQQAINQSYLNGSVYKFANYNDMVTELFVRLFIKINPYGLHTHVITTYIDNLKKNMDAKLID